MIHEEELEHHRASGLDAIALRSHDHALGRHRVARNLQLGHAFDLDHADAAESRRAELGVIAVDRNLLLDRLRRLDEQRAFRHGNRHAVDRDVHHVARHAAHRIRDLKRVREPQHDRLEERLDRIAERAEIQAGDRARDAREHLVVARNAAMMHQPVEDALHPASAFATRRALPARLVREETNQIVRGLHESRSYRRTRRRRPSRASIPPSSCSRNRTANPDALRRCTPTSRRPAVPP